MQLTQNQAWIADFKDPDDARQACRFLYKAVVAGADLITTLVDPQDLPVSDDSIDAEKKLIMSHFDKIAAMNFADLPPPPQQYKPRPDVPDPILLSTSDFEIKARWPLSPLSASTDYGNPLSPSSNRRLQGLSPQTPQSMLRSSSFASFSSRFTDPVQRSPALGRVSQLQFATPVKRAVSSSFVGPSPARSSLPKPLDSARSRAATRETWHKKDDTSTESPVASPYATPSRRRSSASMPPVVSVLSLQRKDSRLKQFVPVGNKLSIQSLAQGKSP